MFTYDTFSGDIHELINEYTLTRLYEGFSSGRWCCRALGTMVHIICNSGARVPARSELTSNNPDY